MEIHELEGRELTKRAAEVMGYTCVDYVGMGSGYRVMAGEPKGSGRESIHDFACEWGGIPEMVAWIESHGVTFSLAHYTHLNAPLAVKPGEPGFWECDCRFPDASPESLVPIDWSASTGPAAVARAVVDLDRRLKLIAADKEQST